MVGTNLLNYLKNYAKNDMQYIALLRGINVGGNRKVEMKRLRELFESMGCTNVSTYLNSGNVLFELGTNKTKPAQEIQSRLKKEFGFEIQTLVKSKKEIKTIANSIPDSWKNDSEQKSDVAFLFDEINSKDILEELPMRKEFMDIKYVKGAVMWNIYRQNLNKSQLNKLVPLKIYKLMTIRNVNTARFLAK